MLDKAKLDSTLEKLVSLASAEVDKAVVKGAFAQDLAEAVCVVLSVAYERFRKE